MKSVINIRCSITYSRLLYLLLGLLLTSCSQGDDFYLIDGSAHRLKEYNGQWLLVNFWADWCSPCREEVPALNRLHRHRREQNLTILGVSYDPLENHQIKKLISEWKIEYPVLASKPMPILSFKLPKSLPSNYIFNPQGELVMKISGKQSFESLSKILKSLKEKKR